MAIRVLLDHGVPQANIIFVTFIVAACGGVRVLQRAFPGVRIVCGAVDPVLRESWALWDITAPDAKDAAHETEEEEAVSTVQTKAEAEAEGRKVWVVEPGMGHIGERAAARCDCFSLTSGHTCKATDTTCDERACKRCCAINHGPAPGHMGD